MKNLYLIAFLSFFSMTYAQSEKTLEETKSYIVRMMNEYAWAHKSSSKQLHAEFEGNFLKITVAGKSDKNSKDAPVYNFTQVYKFKGPIREPGDIGRILIWADYRVYSNEWVKECMDIDIHNYNAAVELMNAFRHLNKLLEEAKPAVEKF